MWELTYSAYYVRPDGTWGWPITVGAGKNKNSWHTPEKLAKATETFNQILSEDNEITSRHGKGTIESFGWGIAAKRTLWGSSCNVLTSTTPKVLLEARGTYNPPRK